jgi:hypothetical protein
LLRARYITLVNLYAAARIEKLGHETFDPDQPGAEVVPMPEYLACVDKSTEMARHVVRWWENPSEYRAAVERLERLAARFAAPGASRRTAMYLCWSLEKQANSSRRAA